MMSSLSLDRCSRRQMLTGITFDAAAQGAP